MINKINYDPITDWDRDIMKEYPLRFPLPCRENFWAATGFCIDTYTDGVTWKGPVFYFKNPDDLVLFILRWS
jgi:hypothetical protein